MSEGANSPYKPMYKVRPYFVIRKVKLPDCMYLIQPIHKLPSLTSDEGDYQRALDNLEERQEKIFARIKELQESVIKAGTDVGLSVEEMQRLTESYVSDGTPLDVVVTTPPTSPPYPLLALYECIKRLGVSVCLKSFVHSSAIGRVPPVLVNRFNSNNGLKPSLKITVIWRDVQETSMMFAPGKQVPISGIANICRFVSRRFCPDIYEPSPAHHSSPASDSTPFVTTGMNDSWLDTFSISYLHGNAKEKNSVLRQMNSTLGNKEYLTGTNLTLADIVLFSVIGTDNGLKIGGNVKKWMNRCHQQMILKCVPCVYLDQN